MDDGVLEPVPRRGRRAVNFRLIAEQFLAICRLIGRLIGRWGRLTRAWGFKWTRTALLGSIGHRQSCLNNKAQRS